LLIAVLPLFGSLLSPAAAQSSAAPPVSAAGRGCEQGLEFAADRGEGRPPLCTHGPDALIPGERVLGDTYVGPSMSSGASPGAAVGAAAGAQCVDPTYAQPAVQFVYGYPAGTTERLGEQQALLEQHVATFDGWLDTHAGYRITTVCSAGRITLPSVQLPAVGTDETFTYSDMVNALKAKGMNNPQRAYVVYTDNLGVSYPYCGQGNKDADDQPDPARNASNVGPHYSLVNCLGGTMLHELVHNLGGVQNSAPHSSGAGHCYDENDLECYDDGGTYFSGGGQITTPCAGRVVDYRFDCNNDDYFSRLPAPAGNYLATHWNLASSYFLRNMYGASIQQPINDLRSPLAYFAAPSGPGRVALGGSMSVGTSDDVAPTQVDFYRETAGGRSLLGSRTDFPFSLPWYEVPSSVDAQTFTADVTDASGKTTTVTMSGVVLDTGNPPAVPQIGTATRGKVNRTSAVTLTWTDADADVRSFQVRRSTTPAFDTSVFFLQRPGGDRKLVDASISGRATYYYQVRAVMPTGTATAWSGTAVASR